MVLCSAAVGVAVGLRPGGGRALRRVPAHSGPPRVRGRWRGARADGVGHAEREPADARLDRGRHLVLHDRDTRARGGRMAARRNIARRAEHRRGAEPDRARPAGGVPGQGTGDRAVVAGGILVAPVAGANSTLMLSNPDHLATQIFVLGAWLIVDRARPRWWVPVAVAAVLAWARMSDSIVLLEAELPLLVVCAVRIYRRGGALRDQWYELSLGGAAIAAELIAQLGLRAIRAR